MSTFYHGKLPASCPRCKKKLPLGEISCYNCGLRLSKDPSYKQKRKALMTYLICIILVGAIFAGFFFHSAGISLSSIFAKGTPRPTAVPYPSPRGTPLFSDNFVSDTTGWNLQSSPGNYAVTLNNGTLTMQVSKNQLLWELLPGEKTYSNFTLTVNATLAQGDPNNGYGVYIRGTANSKTDMANYYRFELYGDGSYAIFKGAVDANGVSATTKLVDYTLNPAIKKQGSLNKIMIIAKGASLSFIVNGQLLKTVTNDSYASGTIALFVSNLPQAKPGAQVQFTQFAIYPPQA